MLADTTFLLDRSRPENTKYKSCSDCCFTLGLPCCFKYKSLESVSRFDYSYIKENLSLQPNEFITTFLPNQNFTVFLVLSNKGILNIIGASKSHMRDQLKKIGKIIEIKSILWLEADIFAVGTEKGDLDIYHLKITDDKLRMENIASSNTPIPQSIHQSWLSYLTFIASSSSTFIIATSASDGTLSLWKFDFITHSPSNSRLYGIDHIWDKADFALVGAMSFSPTGEQIAFSKSNRVFVSQLNLTAISKSSDGFIGKSSAIINTASSLIPPSRVSSILWNSLNSIRVYTLSGHLINMKVDDSSTILEVESDETEFLQDLLIKQIKSTETDADYDDEAVDDSVKSSVHTRMVAGKKMIPIIGVHPSFHNLSDTICFKYDGSICESKSTIPSRTKLSICVRFLEHIDLNQAVEFLKNDLEKKNTVNQVSPMSLFRDILPFFNRSHEEMKQAIKVLKDVIQSAMGQIDSLDYVYPIQRNLRIKLNQFHSFLLITYLDQWSNVISESEKLEFLAELDEKRNEIFATLAGHVLQYLASYDSSSWTFSELSAFARYSEAAPEDLRPLSMQIIERLNECDLAKFKSISAQTTLLEECKACKKEIPFVTLFNGSCADGHFWQRCSLGYQILDGIISKTCEFCKLKQLNYNGEAETAEWRGKLGNLFQTITECIYCGSEMTMPPFRLR